MMKHEAIGLVETFGLVFALEAADAMCKAAAVELVGYTNVASGYISIIVMGDVEACNAAVESGVKRVKGMEGGNLYSSVVIARPHEDLWKIVNKYAIEIM